MRVAVVGSGVAGLAAAWTLARAGVQVVLYEKDDHIGGHAYTVDADGIGLDLGFMVFNQVTYPNMLSFFEDLNVETETSDMSFAVSLGEGQGCEWSSTGLAGLFAQKRNIIDPSFWNMIREIVKFEKDVLTYLSRVEGDDKNTDPNETLGAFIQAHGYSKKFVECYLIPVCGSIWSCGSEGVLGFSAVSILSFCRNHHLLQLLGRPQWLTVKGRSKTYVDKIIEQLKVARAEIRIGTAVTGVTSCADGKVQVEDDKGMLDIFDKCVVAAHAPDALKLRGEDASSSERGVLGAFDYVYSDIFLHRDERFMPKNKAAWSAWNFLGDTDGKVCLTYWLNLLQNLGDTGRPFLVTLNPRRQPNHVELFWRTSHPVPTTEAANASEGLWSIQGHHGVYYCGAYQGYGFHEDGLKSGFTAARSLLDQKFEALALVNHMVPTWLEYGAQQAVFSVLRKFVRTGILRFVEVGGSVYEFEGTETSNLKCTLRIHDPAFYWKIATRADLGLADAYIDGDFSFVGHTPKNDLLSFIKLIIANRDTARNEDSSKLQRGWWSPLFLTSALGSAASYCRHVFRGNSLTNSRRNISQHYDLGNDFFSLFLDRTMTYSCALFKGPDDTLEDAQMRKVRLLIDKAKIGPGDEVLEIGFGWGCLAIEVVRRTGCRYTGITLSQEQLKYAENRVKEAGLENEITFLMCDYRLLEDHHKFNRIISCEMLEAVGHEFYKEFFSRCDHLLAKDGLIVLQAITIPDERYEEYRRSSDFIKEYIFPGGCLPCLGAITSALKAGSSLCVEQLENIGLHYSQTLNHWRKNFHSNRREIMALGFDEKFIRTWDYYFVYCSAGFQSCTLGNIQLVLSRAGNVKALGNAYDSFPSVQWALQEDDDY